MPLSSLAGFLFSYHFTGNSPLTVCFLIGISIARQDGTFKQDVHGNRGMALKSDPKLVRAVHDLTSVRKHSTGEIVSMLRFLYKKDLADTAENRKRKREEKEMQSAMRAASAAGKANEAKETVLCSSVEEVSDELAACGSRKSAKIEFLKKQLAKRMMLAR